MRDAAPAKQLFDLTGEPTRRGTPDKDNRLNVRGNLTVPVVTSDVPVRNNARRGI